MTTTLDFNINPNGYIQLPVDVDPSTLQENALVAIGNALPGWSPREGHIEVLLLEQFAAMAAESAQVAANVPLAIFSYFGTLIGINPNQGNTATAQTTWTMVDDKGYNVSAGTLVGYQVLGNQVYQFATVDPFTVPAGRTQTAPGAVLIEATTVGTTFNNIPPQDLILVASLAFVAQVQSTTTTSGGADQETTAAYLNRLSNELRLLAPRPILPQDFAALAQSVPGVYRAAGFNGLDPGANILNDQDSEFSVGLGTWTSTQNCTISIQTGSYSEEVIQILAGSGGTDAIISTGTYPVSPLHDYLVHIVMDEAQASHATTVYVGANIFDVNGNHVETFQSPLTLDSTNRLTAVIDTFTTPATAFRAQVFVGVTTPTTSTYHQLARACFMAMEPPANYVPDSAFQEVPSSLSWYGGTGGSTAIPPANAQLVAFGSGQNSFTYTGTGAPSTEELSSQRFYLPAGTYTASGYIDASNITAGQPRLFVTDDTATVLAQVSQIGGTFGTVTVGFTLGAPDMVQFHFDNHNSVTQTGETLVYAQPSIVLGTFTSYSVGAAVEPANMMFNNERMVTVGAVDVDGNGLAEQVEVSLATYLESQREVNFIVNVVGPSYTSIDVIWAGVAKLNANPGDVQTAGNAALTAYLSPANWAGGNQVPPFWDASQTVVRYLSVVGLLNDTPGLDYLTSVQLGYHGGTLGTADVPLLGSAPLPLVGNITGNVLSQ